jgi:rSAM/selenodomain-associated transferase 1
MLKTPVAGRVKTRLGGEIGMGRAAAIFRVLTKHTIAEASRGGWRTVLAVDPPSATHSTAQYWPPHLKRIPQGRGDLGARMKRVFEEAPPGPLVIIGADAPGFRARLVRAAFDALRSADAVFGPAEDGGYWLIGLARKRAAPDLFDGVRWSTKHALKDTLKGLPEGFRVRMLQTLGDIDEAKDLLLLGSAAKAR